MGVLCLSAIFQHCLFLIGVELAGLVKSGNKFYVQFFDVKKRPKRKQVPTGANTLSVPCRMQRKLETAYVLGEFDLWVMNIEQEEEKAAKSIKGILLKKPIDHILQLYPPFI